MVAEVTSAIPLIKKGHDFNRDPFSVYSVS